ncbi:MAG: hypothetical protein U1F36_01830 [Planctomycetota bacterium]
MSTWAFCFAITLLVEVPIVVACGPRARRGGVALDAVLANTLTHPLAWLAIQHGMNWWWVEGIVPVVEAVVYRKVTRLTWGRAVWASLLANTTTAALSFAL